MGKRQFAVIGLGRFGRSVARTLAGMGYEVMAIDKNEELVEEIKDQVTYAVCVDIHEEKVLESLGLRNFDVVVVAIGDDLQASILITLMLKEMGIGHVVVKAVNDIHGKVLEKVGADQVVFPERDMGMRLAQYLARANILDFIEISEEYSLIEAKVPPKMVGKTLREIDLRSKYGVSVLAIKRGHKVIVSPPADERLGASDILFIVGGNRELDRFSRM